MPTDAMPVTALAVLTLIAGAMGLVTALVVVLIMLTIYRERRDIRRAKAIGKAKREMKERNRRLKEEEAHRHAQDDLYFEAYQEIVDGL